MPTRESQVPTRWAILCPQHGQVYLTDAEYNRQMDRPAARWKCPRCGQVSDFDDSNYEYPLN